MTMARSTMMVTDKMDKKMSSHRTQSEPTKVAARMRSVMRIGHVQEKDQPEGRFRRES